MPDTQLETCKMLEVFSHSSTRNICICIVRILLISLSPSLYKETFCTWVSIFVIVYFLAIPPCQNTVNCLGLFSFPVLLPTTPSLYRCIRNSQSFSKEVSEPANISQDEAACKGLKWRAVSPVALRRQENRGEDMDTGGQCNRCEDMGGYVEDEVSLLADTQRISAAKPPSVGCVRLNGFISFPSFPLSLLLFLPRRNST